MSNGGVVVVIAGQDNTEKVFQQIEANLGRTQQRAKETENALASLGEKGKRSLELIGVALGVREVVEGLKEVVRNSLEYGEAINDANTKTGLAVETLSVLHYAASQAGTDFEGVTSAVAKMDKTIAAAANGNRQAAAILNQVGLNATDLASRTDGVEVAFKRVTQSIAATESPIRRVELATSLFGKSGADLIETLVNIGNNFDWYKQKTQQAGLFLTPQSAAELEATNKALKQIQASAQGAGVAFTQGFVPALSQMIQVINGANTSTETLGNLGNFVAKSLAAAATVVYSLASAVETLFAAAELGSLTSAGSKDLAAARKLAEQAAQFRDIAMGNSSLSKSSLSVGPPDSATGAGGGFGGTGDVAERDKIIAAMKQRDAALLRLAEQGESFRALEARNAQERALAQLENDHKQQLISDSDYYAQKLAIQNAAYSQQIAAAQAKEKDINAAIGKLRADRNSQGGSAQGIEDEAKIADLETKRKQIEGEIAKIQTDAGKTRIETEQSLYELQQKRLATSNDLAAKVESQHGLSVDARLKQNDDQYSIERERLVKEYGAGSVEVGNADQIDKDRRDRISASGPDETYNAQLASINAQRAGVDAARSRGLITSQQQQRQLIALNQQEAAALQPVLESYERLADDDGDLAATAKVAELKEKIAELSSPINDIALEIQDGFNGAFESLFTNLDQGTKAFENFGRSIERTISNALYRQFLEAPINNLTKSLAGQIPGISQPVPVVGTQNEWSKTGGGFSIGKALGGLLGGGGGSAAGPTGAAKGAGMNVTVTLVNDSGTALKIGDIAKQGGSDLDKFEALVSQSFGSGGIMRQLLQGA